jgi:U4/U6 small nuclear ribonucleoprotein PRP31
MSSSFADERLGELDDGVVDQAGVDDVEDGLGNADGWGEMQEDESSDGDADVLDDKQEAEEASALDSRAQFSSSASKHAAKPEEEMAEADIEQLDLRPESVRSVYEVCTLSRSTRLREIMNEVERRSKLPEPDLDGVLEDSPEYHLIVQANNLAVNVDNEIMIVHKFIRQHYQPRFPELESLISDPWEFVEAVRAIGNGDNLANTAQLDGILPHGTVVVISMQASTTKGRRLTPDAWRNVSEACDLLRGLEQSRQKILEYVQSRMTFIAPNLSKVVGSRVATKLLGIAGGLTAFIKIPACNVILLGASKRTATGMSTAFSGRHEGFVAQAPLVANSPAEIHRQAMRIVSAKALLAARVDAGGSDRNGTYGARLTQELERKLEKLQEPPPAKMIKVLPIPHEGANPKKRRGGRRARTAKERNGMTEMRKMQNRVRFGEAEEEVGAFDETVGMGMINAKGDTGRLRVTSANEASRARMSKRNTQRIQAIQQGVGAARRLESYEAAGEGSGKGSVETSGTASSLAFTPFQGIELVDPSRQSKVEEANAKWFKEGTFSLAPNAKSSTRTADGFAIPSLPTSKPNHTDTNKRTRLE